MQGYLSGGIDLDLIVFKGHSDAAMRLQVEVVLPPHSGHPFYHMVALP